MFSNRTASNSNGKSPYRNPISSSGGPATVKPPGPSLSALAPSDSHLAPLFTHPQPNDVRFSFPRSSSELWANSSVLSAASPYFNDLFTSQFSEGQKCGERKRRKVNAEPHKVLVEQDSDDELDGRRVPPKVNELLPTPLEFFEVVVMDAAYSTYHAVLVWIYSPGSLAFAPIRSSDGPKTKVASASPKSVYRLAHFLDIPTLRALALAALTPMITATNAAVELFSSETSRLYPEVQAMLIQFVASNWAAVKESPGMREIERKLEADEDVPMGGAIMFKLMRVTAERAETASSTDAGQAGDGWSADW